MRTEELHDVIATDIPRASAADVAPLEMDDDIDRRDAWMFVPLLAAVIALPIVATALLGTAVWHIASGASASSQPTTFASRWPDKAMPQVILR